MGTSAKPDERIETANQDESEDSDCLCGECPPVRLQYQDMVHEGPESSPAMDRSLLQTGVVQQEGPPAQDDAGPRQEYARLEERDGGENSEMACRNESTGKDRPRPENERLQVYEGSRFRLAEDAGDTP